MIFADCVGHMRVNTMANQIAIGALIVLCVGLRNGPAHSQVMDASVDNQSKQSGTEASHLRDEPATAHGLDALGRAVGNTLVKQDAPNGPFAMYLESDGRADVVSGQEKYTGHWSYSGGKLCLERDGRTVCGEMDASGQEISLAAPERITFRIVQGNALAKFTAPGAAPTAVTLTGVEALHEVAGNTAIGTPKSQPVVIFMEKDGGYKFKLGSDRIRVGKWYYSGSRLCLDERHKTCFEMSVRGHQITLSFNGDKMTLSILPGNARNL